MIIVNLMGGMGNLMFQYAYARALQEELGESAKFNAQFMNLICIGTQHRPNTNNALLHLRLTDSIRFTHTISGYIKGALDAFRFLSYRKKKKGNLLHGQKSYTILSQKGFLFTDDYLSYYLHAQTMKNKKTLIGGFNSPDYFTGMDDQLRKELRVVSPPSAQNVRKMQELSSCNSVCVHIRRGDYIATPKNDFFVVCDENYYAEGMHYIAAHTSNPVFYIFSDNNEEINWIQSHYRFDYPVHFITLNNPDYEELRLMYSCKHFVISNSTFSWWGSYLSDNPNKIIVAPSTWSKNYKASQDVYTENMVLLETHPKERDSK